MTGGRGGVRGRVLLARPRGGKPVVGVDHPEVSEVVGPEHCQHHRTHLVGCLLCAAEVAEAHPDESLEAFVARMRAIGWDVDGDESTL